MLAAARSRGPAVALRAGAIQRAAALLPTPGASRALPVALRRLSTQPDDAELVSTKHFRLTDQPHPLKAKPTERLSREGYEGKEREYSNHIGRQQNYIWTPAELEEKLRTAQDVHTPTTVMDHVMHSIMYYGLYHPFNFITGYTQKDPSPRSIEWRLIILESFAGVPGFVAAGFRHFRSLRLLKKDYGWIHTLLEEAENERMHLLTCLKMFEAGPVTRVLCVGAQLAMTPFLMAVYMVEPRAVHRFVGYLEQTACHTYKNIIDHVETPGTRLHAAWSKLPAPEIAKGYWHLPEDAMWVDALKCMYADEANHRDVNHTFASMQSDDPNPYVAKHREAAARAWKIIEAEKALREVGRKVA